MEHQHLTINSTKSTYNNLVKEVDISLLEHNRDIYYNIMLNSDFKTMQLLCITNNTFNIIYNDKHFWNEKFNKDYKLIQLQNNMNTKDEYKKTYIANITANNLIEVMLLLEESSCHFADFYISEYIDITNLYWLPKNILKYTHIDGLLEFRVCSNTFTISLKLFIDNQMKIKEIEYLSKTEFVDFFTILLYHYSDIPDVISDINNDPYLYEDLITPYEDNEDNYIIKHRLKYWKLLKIKSHHLIKISGGYFGHKGTQGPFAD